MYRVWLACQSHCVTRVERIAWRKEASRLAVLKAVDELNYRPNVIAQSLLSQSTGCIGGVICAQDNINQTTGYLYALEKHLSQHQKHLLLRFANTKAEVMSALDELSCGLCDDVLIIGARFPLNINQENVILVDCLDSGDDVNSIQFDHEVRYRNSNYLISQNRRQIALIHPDGMGFSDQVLLGYKHALEKTSCRLTVTWYLWLQRHRRWPCRSC